MAERTVVFPPPPLPPMVKTIRRLAGFLMVLSVLMIVLWLNWELKFGHCYEGCPTRTPLLAEWMPADSRRRLCREIAFANFPDTAPAEPSQSCALYPNEPSAHIWSQVAR